MHDVTVAIIARDEARHIGDCLASIGDLTTDVLVLLDERTRDDTAAICRAAGATVQLTAWRGFAGQRNYALQQARGAWVLFLDADERLTAELRVAIAALPAAPAVVGYRMPRHNVFFGRRLRGGGWYPDYQLRLLRRGVAHYDEQVLVHEVARLAGEVATLDAHMLHINIEQVGEFWHKQCRYALAEARTLYMQGHRARWRGFVGAPVREFWGRYVRLGGWRDGGLGLALCGAMGWFALVRTACLYLLAGRRR